MRSCTVYRYVYMFVNTSVSDVYIICVEVDYLSQDIQTTARETKRYRLDISASFLRIPICIYQCANYNFLSYFMYVVQWGRSKEQNRRKALRR